MFIKGQQRIATRGQDMALEVKHEDKLSWLYVYTMLGLYLIDIYKDCRASVTPTDHDIFSSRFNKHHVMSTAWASL